MLYGYDSNGNITHDGDSNVDFTYDYQNHVQKAEYNGSLLAKYSYLADGTKFEAVDGGGNGLRYIGSLVYKKQSGISGVSLESAAFGGGRFRVSQGADGVTYIPNYYITDHLGSTRAIVENGQAIAEYNYYPYGSEWSTADMLHSDDNRYRYTGKESQSFLELPFTDYGARMYNGVHWNGIDKLAEIDYSGSPYVYCGGNPILRVDLDGKIWETIWDIGNIVYDVGAAVYQHISGNKDKAKSHWKDAGWDLGAALTPFVPAGASKVVRYTDKAVDYVENLVTVFKAGKNYNPEIFLKFTSRNFRANLARLTGQIPEGMEAHHILPQKFIIYFQRAKLDINNPLNGIWLDKMKHAKGSYKYNQKWDEFFEYYRKRGIEPTQSKIISKAKQFMKEVYDIEI